MAADVKTHLYEWSTTESSNLPVGVHSDTVGPADKNQELALNRARSEADLLKTQGLAALAIAIESHGESNPLVKTPDETAEPRNRRVEITIR